MNRIASCLFERIPFLEVLCRRFFYLIKRDAKPNTIEKHKKRVKTKTVVNEKSKDFFLNYIDSLGIRNGDVLIVHSGYSELKKTGLSIKGIIEYLLKLVGKDGTLVLPAYPDYSDQTELPLRYDVKKTRSWTGILPNIFCSNFEVKRSCFPNNSLSCKGKMTDFILKSNRKAVFPHGENSAWYNCVLLHAKILFIGTDIAHSNTVVHVAEDYLGDLFPIKDWYEEIPYLVQNGDESFGITVKQRRQFWSRFIDEYRNTKRLKNKGLAKEVFVYGIHIGFIPDSHDVFMEILNRAKDNKLEYKIPKRYWR